MAKSIKLKNNTYWAANSILMKNKLLDIWLEERVFMTSKVLGKINEYFTSQKGYKSVSIDIPPHTAYIITGLSTGQIANIVELQVTPLYNSIYINNNDNVETYSYWFDYFYPGNISTSSGNVSLDILAIKL